MSIYHRDYFDEFSGVSVDNASEKADGLSWVRHEVRQHGLESFLDYGCGHGELMRALTDEGLQVTGADVSRHQMDRLRSEGLEAMTFDELDRRFRQYDAVHLSDVLEHVPYPRQTLAHAASFIRPGGYLLVQGPLEGDQDTFAKAVRLATSRRSRPIRIPPWHLHQFSLRGFLTLFNGLPLETRYQVSSVSWPAPRTFRDGCASGRSLALWCLREATARFDQVARGERGNRVRLVGVVRSTT